MVVQINPRQQQIMDRAQQSGFVAIESLSREFGVTSQTIRRDINHLCGLGMLLRYHGGAGLPTNALPASGRPILSTKPLLNSKPLLNPKPLPPTAHAPKP